MKDLQVAGVAFVALFVAICCTAVDLYRGTLDLIVPELLCWGFAGLALWALASYWLGLLHVAILRRVTAGAANRYGPQGR